MKRKTVILMCALVSTLPRRMRETGATASSLHRVFPRSVRRKKNRSSRESRRRRWIQRRRRRKAAPKAARPQKAARTARKHRRKPGSASGTADSAITPGTTQLDALPIPLGTRMQGTIDAHTYAWFSFSTGQEAGATYNITLINASPDGNAIMVYLYDSDGEELYYGRATENGVPGPSARIS